MPRQDETLVPGVIGRTALTGTKVRILGLALGGTLALSAAAAAHADPLGSKMTSAGPMPGVVQLDATAPRHAMPSERGAVRQPVPLHPAQSDGRTRPYWTPNHANGSWGPHSAWGAPYPVWGGPYVPYVWGVPYVAVPYVPYRYYGDWGALWYPYAEWRGPHGGWGNPKPMAAQTARADRAPPRRDRFGRRQIRSE